MLWCVPPELGTKDVRGGPVELPRELAEVTEEERQSLAGLLVWRGSLPYFRDDLELETWSRDDLRALGELLERVHVSLARIDPAAFVQFALRHETNEDLEIVNAQHHEDWHRFLDDNPIAVLFAAVEHAKTQQIAIGRALFALGTNPNRTIAIVSDTEGQAKKNGTAIMRHIAENPRVRRVFPGLRPSPLPTDPWSELRFTVERSSLSAKDPSVQCLGVMGAINGSRLDVLIFDDLLDLRNTATNEQIAKILNWIDTTALTRLREDGVLWWIGTPWKRNDPMHVVAARPGVARLEHAAVLNPDEPDPARWIPRWPEQWSVARLRKKWRTMDPLAFARKYLLRIRNDEDARFDLAWIRRAFDFGRGYRLELRQPVIEGVLAPCFTGVDLGIGRKKKNHRSAVVTIAKHGARFRIVGLRSGKWKAPELLQIIRDETTRFRSIAYVENNQAQDFLVQFATEGINGADSLPVVGFTTGANKHDPSFGVESLAVDLRNSLWIFPSGDGTDEDIDPELLALRADLEFYDPTAHTPDRLMALWFARMASRFGAGADAARSWTHDFLNR